MGVSKVDLGDQTLIDLTKDTVSASALLSGITAHGKDGEQISGNIPNRGAGGGTISKKGGSVAIPEGYYDGTGSVSIASDEQAKIIAGNIKQGVSILGVTGTFSDFTNYVTGTFIGNGTTSLTLPSTDFTSKFVVVVVNTGQVKSSGSSDFKVVETFAYRNDGNIIERTAYVQKYTSGSTIYAYGGKTSGQWNKSDNKWIFNAASAVWESGVEFIYHIWG